MEVLFLSDYATPARIYKRGEVYKLAKVDAKRYILNGIAAPVNIQAPTFHNMQVWEKR